MVVLVLCFILSFLHAADEHCISLSQKSDDIPHEATCQYMIDTAVAKYFAHDPAMADRLRPHIDNILNDIKRSSRREHYARYQTYALNPDNSPERSSNDADLDLFVEEVISRVLTAQMDMDRESMEELREESRRRIPRKQVAIITGVTSIVLAGITAATTLSIHFSGC